MVQSSAAYRPTYVSQKSFSAPDSGGVQLSLSAPPPPRSFTGSLLKARRGENSRENSLERNSRHSMLPTPHELRLPILQEASAREEVAVRDLVELFTKQFNVTVEDRAAATHRNQSQSVFGRIQTARDYLSREGLIETSRRGHIRITPLGRAAIETRKSARSVDRFSPSALPEPRTE